MTTAGEPPGAAVARTGRFSTAILKLTAVCNLNCSYCYMFNLGDLTFTTTSRMMSPQVAEAALDAVGDYCLEHGLATFTIALHGGEPTLWPLANHERVLARAAEWRTRGVDLRVLVQSNGVHLPDPLMDLWAEHHVGLGISVDGPAAVNDRHRVRHDGKGSYDLVMATVDRLHRRDRGSILNGFLCVAQPDVPAADFLAWAEQLPAGIDVLWPIDFHYGNPPWSAVGFDEYTRTPRYGTWFSELFLLWAAAQRAVRIRQFDQAVAVCLGGRSTVDSMTNEQVPVLVVNTDGQVELNDYVRSYEDGAASTGLTVWDGLDAAAADESFRYYLNLVDHRPQECAGCAVVSSCGGGFLPGRMMPGHDRPVGRSVLCFDQFTFFQTVRSVVTEAHQRASTAQPSQ